MLETIREDVRTALETDPAAKRPAEVLLYAGLHAVWAHHLTHWLWSRGHRLSARALSQVVRFLTGVEIHPAATLGRRVFVDHGMGVVVGETATVGDDVTMYHGVTLGGNDPRPVERHPTVGDGVTLGAQSTLVGDITVGDGATVGAGAVVVEDVPPGSTVAGNPAERIDDGDDLSEAADGAGDAAVTIDDFAPVTDQRGVGDSGEGSDESNESDEVPDDVSGTGEPSACRPEC